VDNAEITENGEPPEKTSSPESAMQDVSGNADIAGSSSSGDATLAKTDARASLVSGTVRNTHAVLLSLPRPELQLLCSLLAREGYARI